MEKQLCHTIRKQTHKKGGCGMFDQEHFPEEYDSPLANNKNHPKINMAEIPEGQRSSL